MDEEAAFLMGIMAEPGCDVRRLVYADWLQERETPADEAHAQFIRGQIDRLHDRPPIALTAEEQALLTVHETAWRHGLPATLRGFVRYRRGFPYLLQCDSVALLRAWATGPLLVPVEDLTLVVRSLDIGWLTLARPEPMLPLRRFVIQSNAPAGDFLPRILARVGPFQHLKTLEIHDLSLGDLLFSVTDPAAVFPSLNRLNLSYCQLTDESAEWLATSVWAAGLRHLDVRGNLFSPSRINWLLDRFGTRCVVSR